MKRLQLAANSTAAAAAAAASAAAAIAAAAAAAASSNSTSSTRRRSKTAGSTTSSSPSSSSSSSSGDTAISAAVDPEISGQMGASLAAWFADAHNKLLLNELRDAGVAVCQEDPEAADVVSEDGLSAANINVPGSIPGA
jgi:hypothetical protein